MGTHKQALAAVLSFSVLFVGLAFGRTATAEEGAVQFVRTTDARLTALLRKPESPSRNQELDAVLEQLIDFDELSRRAFGDPCPETLPTCADLWTGLKPAERAQAKDLLRRLVEKNYRQHLVQILGFQVSYEGVDQASGLEEVRTEARQPAKPRDPPVQVAYVLEGRSGRYRIVDLVTEGASLTKSYYEQFRRMLADPSEGFPHIVERLRAKIAER
jgi:phospholipid transport system substrate-binding protein